MDNATTTPIAQVASSSMDVSSSNNEPCPHCGKLFTSRGTILSKYNSCTTSVSSSQRNTGQINSCDQQSVNRMIEDLNTIPKNATTTKKKLPETIEFETKFNDILLRGTLDKFEDLTCNFINYLTQANNTLPGPKHPAIRYYNAHRKHKEGRGISYSTTKNPSKLAERKRNQNKQKYQYELAQFQYYNQRRKVVRNIMNSQNNKRCQISVNTVSEYFQKLYGEENPLSSIDSKELLSTEQDIEIQEAEIKIAMSRMKVDTAAGPDRIILRTLKELQTSKVLCLLSNCMLTHKCCPSILKVARTILIYKGGEENIISNWRPITIFSVVRRIIEKVLDTRLRAFVNLSSHQRGFISLPGTHINSSIINGCIQSAKREQRSCCIAFLDITKAYDNVGHDHIRRCLYHTNMPNNLRNLILDLIEGNNIKVEVGLNKSRSIVLRKGVAQGSPLSPILFNMAIDDVMKEITEFEVTQAYGFDLSENVSKLLALAFADDIALIGKNLESTQVIINMVTRLLSDIGLQVNPKKCNIINIENGTLQRASLQLSSGDIITSIDHQGMIKYLAVTFTDGIMLDEVKLIRDFTRDLELLVTSTLLRADQKLNIINQFIWPRLIYSLQSTPLNKIPSKFLIDLDKIIRNSTKEIIGLPHDIPSDMLYAPRNFCGLGIVKVEWEAYLQHFNIAQKLLKINDEHLHICRDVKSEKRDALTKLNINISNETSSKTARRIRCELREKAFENWCQLPHKGKGVTTYKEDPRSNKWVSNRKGFSSSEWTNAIKMSCNTSAVRSVPGRSTHNNLCRHPTCNEVETLGHVLGFCPKGELQRIARHHKIRSSIATSLRKAQWEVYEEVHCVAEDGSFRRADIVALNRQQQRALILDPTIRFETDGQQSSQVNEEKKAIYNPCIPHFSERYKIPINAWEVMGLLFGARGTSFKLTRNFLTSLKISNADYDKLLVMIMRDSLSLLHNHLYCNC